MLTGLSYSSYLYDNLLTRFPSTDSWPPPVVLVVDEAVVVTAVVSAVGVAVMDPVPVTTATLVVVESGLLLWNEPVVVKPTVVLPSVFTRKEHGADAWLDCR